MAHVTIFSARESTRCSARAASSTGRAVPGCDVGGNSHTPVLARAIPRGNERYDAPEAPGLDVVLRGLSMIGDDEHTLTVTGPIFDGLYEFHRRAMLLGREPA